MRNYWLVCRGFDCFFVVCANKQPAAADKQQRGITVVFCRSGELTEATSTGEQKHAKAKRSRVHRAGISVSTMTQQPLNLFKTAGLEAERVLRSSRELSTAKYLLLLFSSPLPPIPSSALPRSECFSHGAIVGQQQEHQCHAQHRAAG